ncbi:MAG: hypothetical protein DRH70_03320 [Candidatus Coatesbacteria bacterium]|nr:MAG: hypothetical protein DRH70_03320 [Candidatus Coatesbacteria bacterium]
MKGLGAYSLWASPLTEQRGRAHHNNQIDAAGSSPLECGGLTSLFLVAARRDIDSMSIKAAAIAFRKEMKLSIGARCQAAANESGVKPPHSKVTQRV